MTIIIPEGMPALEWFDRTTQLFANVIPPFKLMTEGAWREWASAACRAVPSLPYPYNFADWMSWAARFNQIMSAPGVA